MSFRPRNYMGASFQAPLATPGQRLMEMHHASLIIFFVFQYASTTNHTGMYKNECKKKNNKNNNEMAVINLNDKNMHEHNTCKMAS